MYGMADRNEKFKTESIRYCKLPMYNFDMSEIQKLVDSYWQTANKESACENSSESSTESSVSTSSSSETDSSDSDSSSDTAEAPQPKRRKIYLSARKTT